MEQVDSEPWTSKYVCQNCLVTLKMFHQDLMSGCLTVRSYEWFDQRKRFIISYDEDRKQNIMNVKEGSYYEFSLKEHKHAKTK